MVEMFLATAPRERGLEMKMTNKITVVVGHKTDKPENWESMSIEERINSKWKAESFHRAGFWKKESIAKLANKLGFIGNIKVSHTVMDYSGKGGDL